MQFGIMIGGPGDGGEFEATMNIKGHDIPAMWKPCEGRWYERTEENDNQGRIIFKLIDHIGDTPPCIGDVIPLTKAQTLRLVEMYDRGEV